MRLRLDSVRWISAALLAGAPPAHGAAVQAASGQAVEESIAGMVDDGKAAGRRRGADPRR
jgi:hypothetical protein